MPCDTGFIDGLSVRYVDTLDIISDETRWRPAILACFPTFFFHAETPVWGRGRKKMEISAVGPTRTVFSDKFF